MPFDFLVPEDKPIVWISMVPRNRNDKLSIVKDIQMYRGNLKTGFETFNRQANLE